MARHSFFQRLFEVVAREENGGKEKKYDIYVVYARSFTEEHQKETY